MIIQGQVGNTGPFSAGAQPALRQGALGDLIASELHGRYYETACRGMLFNTANQAGQTTSAGLATTYTGLVLSNPLGSGKNLALQKIGYSFLVAFPAAAAIGLLVGFSATTNVVHTTAGVPRSSLFGAGAAGVGLVDTAATLPVAPVVHSVFGTGLTGAITTQEAVSSEMIDLEGGLILPPGAFAGIYTSTASGVAALLASMAWEELPV